MSKVSTLDSVDIKEILAGLAIFLVSLAVFFLLFSMVREVDRNSTRTEIERAKVCQVGEMTQEARILCLYGAK